MRSMATPPPQPSAKLRRPVKPPPPSQTIGQTAHSEAGPGVAITQPAPAPFVTRMTPGDALILQGGGKPTTVAAGVSGQNNAGNAGVSGIQQALANPQMGNSPAQNLAAASKAGVSVGGYDTALTGALASKPQPAATVSRPGASTLAPVGGSAALYQQPGAGQGLAAGGGAAGIQAIDAALTGYDPTVALPGTARAGQLAGRGSMGALPGTVSQGALPSTVGLGALPGQVSMGARPDLVGMGALPGATDRSLQLSALDRVVGYDPTTASLAQAQLADASQMNLANQLAMARSARGGPAAVAAALAQAQGEGAATMSQQARDLAMLRAKEEDTAKQRELEALGLGGELASSMRGQDVLERGQDVGAVEAALQAGVQQRGQTMASLDAELAQMVSQRGQDVEGAIADLQAGAQQRGQTIQSLDNALNAGVTQRGQTIDAIMAERNAGVTERGQEAALIGDQLSADVTQRGQSIDARTQQSQRELDALIARGGLSEAERQAAVQERGQTLDAVMQGESVKQARDAVSAQSWTEAQKIEANLLINQAILNGQLTPEEQFRMQNLINSADDPTLFQQVFAGVMAVGNTAVAAKKSGMF
jgi:hypothetical protein